MIEQQHAAKIRYPDHIDMQIQQVDVNALDARHFIQWQGDVNTTNVLLLQNVPQIGQLAENWQANTVLGLFRGNHAHQRHPVRLAQVPRQFLRQGAGPNDYRAPFVTQLAGMQAIHQMERHVAQHLGNEAQDGPAEHQIERIVMQGVGYTCDCQQAPNQQEPTRQQTQQSGKKPVSFVINLQQRIDMHRAEQGKDAQHAVLTEERAVTRLYHESQQQAHQQHTRSPLSPEGQPAALGDQIAVLRSHRISNPRGLMSDFFRCGQIAIVFVVVAVLARLVQVDLIQYGTHDGRLVL